MAKIFSSPRGPRHWLASDLPEPRRLFRKRAPRNRHDAHNVGLSTRRRAGRLGRLRQRLRWHQFQHPIRARVLALLLPLIVIGFYAGWRTDLPSHPRLRETLDVTLHPLGAVPDSVVALAQGMTGSNPGRFGDCQLMPWGNCVYDGDTIRMDGERIRLATIDTPEIFSPRCGAELALGRRASARLRALLNDGGVELQRSGPRDRDSYGRLLRVVTVDGASAGYTLIQEGLARRWDGARRSWC